MNDHIRREQLDRAPYVAQTEHNPSLARKPYVRPAVESYTANQLMALIGPAEAGSVNPDCDSIMNPCGEAASGGMGYYAPEDKNGLQIG